MIKELIKTKWKIAIVILLALIFILPYMGVVFYTLPRNDEFASAYGITAQGGYSFINLLRYVVDQYINWEGNYSGVFIYTALNPIVIGNSDLTVKIMNILTFSGFVFGWGYILYRCFGLYDIEKKNRLILAVIMLIMSMNCRFLRELLGWYTGYMYYTLQLLLGTLGVILIYDICRGANTTRKLPAVIATVIFEIIGAGGTLHVSVILCFFALLLLLWALYEKKEKKEAIILFCSIVISTIVNLAAPGHRVRKNDYDEISLFQGIICTLKCVLRELKRLCTDTFYPYIFLALFIVLFIVIREKKKNFELNPLVVGIAGLCCIVGSSFPVCYGYGSAKMAPRGLETLDLMYVLWSMLFICSLVNWLMLKGIVLKNEMLLVISVIAMLILSSETLTHVSIADIPSVQCTLRLADGSIKDYSDYWRGKLHEVENSSDSDVVLYVDDYYLDEEMLIDRVMFMEDPTNWANNAAAIYYGHKSIRVQRTGK